MKQKKGNRMPAKTNKKADDKDELYVKIWEVEQRHVTTRWTVSTFFFSISFAIFGISIQTKDSPIPLIVTTSVAIGIYWFAYFLYRRFNDYTSYLRSRLEEMERDGQTTLNLQGRTEPYLTQRKGLTTIQLIQVFGFFYTMGGILISVFFSK